MWRRLNIYGTSDTPAGSSLHSVQYTAHTLTGPSRIRDLSVEAAALEDQHQRTGPIGKMPLLLLPSMQSAQPFLSTQTSHAGVTCCCYASWSAAGGRVVLLGDAAHAMYSGEVE